MIFCVWKFYSITINYKKLLKRKSKFCMMCQQKYNINAGKKQKIIRIFFSSLSANPTKWSNTLKQFVEMFEYFLPFSEVGAERVKKRKENWEGKIGSMLLDYLKHSGKQLKCLRYQKSRISIQRMGSFFSVLDIHIALLLMRNLASAIYQTCEVNLSSHVKLAMLK